MSLPAADHRPLRALIVLSTYLLLCHALQSRLLIHQLRNRIEVIDDEYEFSLTRWDLISYAH